MKDHLKLCPHCGGLGKEDWSVNVQCFIQCEDCKSTGSKSNTVIGAINKWNERFTHIVESVDDPDEAIALLKEIKSILNNMSFNMYK